MRREGWDAGRARLHSAARGGEVDWDGTLGLETLFPDGDEIGAASAVNDATFGVRDEEVSVQVVMTINEELTSSGTPAPGSRSTGPIRSTPGDAIESSAVVPIACP